jgi:hypothetical protein
MPIREDLTDALIALIPEDGSRISNGEIKTELERQLGVPIAVQALEEAKTLVVAMGAAEKARGPHKPQWQRLESAQVDRSR